MFAACYNLFSSWKILVWTKWWVQDQCYYLIFSYYLSVIHLHHNITRNMYQKSVKNNFCKHYINVSLWPARQWNACFTVNKRLIYTLREMSIWLLYQYVNIIYKIKYIPIYLLQNLSSHIHSYVHHEAIEHIKGRYGILILTLL